MLARQEVLEREIQDARRVQLLHDHSQTAGLQREVGTLRESLAQREAQVEALRAEVAELKARGGPGRGLQAGGAKVSPMQP